MSSVKQILKESYCDIYFDEADKILYAKWIGFLKPDQVRRGCSAMTDFIKKNQTKVHLSDHRNLRVLTKDVQDYLTQEWFPEVERAGLRKVAALVSEDIFAKATVESVNHTARVGLLTIRTFDSHHQCLEWLKEEKVEA